MEENKQVESATATAAPAPTSPVQKKGSNKGLIIAVVIILVLCCIGSVVAAGVYLVGSGLSIFSTVQQGGTNEPDESLDQSTDGNSSSNGSDSPGGTSEEYNFGEDFTSLTDTFDVKVDNIRQNGDDYEIDMSIRNTSSNDQPFSTILYLSLVSETNPDGYSQNFFSERYFEEGAQLDGTIPAGELKRGVIVFSVDDNPSSLKLRVTKGLFSQEYLEFRIK